MAVIYVLTAATLSSIVFVSALQQSALQRYTAQQRRISYHSYHPSSSFCSTRHHTGVSRLHTLRSKLDDNDGEEEDDENIINLSEPIDFSDLDGKIFDDVPNYGIIRTLETPEYNPIEPVSVEEIELWIQKKKVQEKQQQKKRLLKKVFPWVSPLTTLLLPKRHAPTTTYESSSSSRSRSNAPRKRHSNFSNNGIGSPKILREFITTPNSARNLLVSINIVAFIYQIVTAVYYLPGFNRILAASVAGDAVSAAALEGIANSIPQWTPSEVILRALGFVGGGAGVVIASGSTMRGVRGRVVGRGPIAAHSMGPFFLDYAHQPYPLSHFQRHRYLSSGFIHGSLLHLGMNLRAMLSLPSWLENGIGKGVYLSAYLVAIVTGNIAHTLTTVGDWRASSSLCIGASGGICGLYGLMLASLLKMGNNNAAVYVTKQMLWLLLYGFLIPGISNAG